MRKLTPTLLHVGCANRYYPGFVNTDKAKVINGNENMVDKLFDLGEPWPFEDKSIDGIVGMHVFQQLPWRNLVVCFREAFRVLRPGGVLRMGCPMIEHEERSLDYLLGWANINLFSLDLIQKVLGRIGFENVHEAQYQQSAIRELGRIDNRVGRGSMYIEATKPRTA